jgi:hypothetical protein
LKSTTFEILRIATTTYYKIFPDNAGGSCHLL